MSSIEGQNASTSLPSGSAGTATGNVVDFGAIYNTIVVAITATATLTAGTILVEGSLDGVNWYTITSITATSITAAGTTTYIASPLVPARFARARISVAVTGGTIAAVIGAAGS